MSFPTPSTERITRVVAQRWTAPTAPTHFDNDEIGGRLHETMPEEHQQLRSDADGIPAGAREHNCITAAFTTSCGSTHASKKKSSRACLGDEDSSCGVGATSSTVASRIDSEPNTKQAYSGQESSRRDVILKTLLRRAGHAGLAGDGSSPICQILEPPIGAGDMLFNPQPSDKKIQNLQTLSTTPTHFNSVVVCGRPHGIVPEEHRHPRSDADGIPVGGRERSGIKVALTTSSGSMPASVKTSSCAGGIDKSSSCGVGFKTSTVASCIASARNTKPVYFWHAASRIDLILESLFRRHGDVGHAVDSSSSTRPTRKFSIGAGDVQLKPRPSVKEIMWHASRKQRRITTPTRLDGDITCPRIHDVVPEDFDSLSSDIEGAVVPTLSQAACLITDTASTSSDRDSLTPEVSHDPGVVHKDSEYGQDDDETTLAPGFESESSRSELGSSQALPHASLVISAVGMNSRSPLIFKDAAGFPQDESPRRCAASFSSCSARMSL